VFVLSPEAVYGPGCTQRPPLQTKGAQQSLFPVHVEHAPFTQAGVLPGQSSHALHDPPLARHPVVARTDGS
jgi:hypothetical protein